LLECWARLHSTSRRAVAPSRFVTIGSNRRALFDLVSSSFTPGRGIVDATTALSSAIFEMFTFDPSSTEAAHRST